AYVPTMTGGPYPGGSLARQLFVPACGMPSPRLFPVLPSSNLLRGVPRWTATFRPKPSYSLHRIYHSLANGQCPCNACLQPTASIDLMQPGNDATAQQARKVVSYIEIYAAWGLRTTS